MPPETLTLGLHGAARTVTGSKYPLEILTREGSVLAPAGFQALGERITWEKGWATHVPDMDERVQL